MPSPRYLTRRRLCSPPAAVARILVVLLLNGCSPGATQQGEAEPTAIEALRTCGAELTFDDHDPARPVIGVRLSARQITDDDLRHIEALPQLRALYLPATPISDAGMIRLSRMRNLETLDLCGTSIGDDGLRHLRDVGSLRTLLLWDTPVTDAGLRHLANLDKLDRLELGRTGVSDAGLIAVGQCHTLTRLDLSRTAISDDGIHHLLPLNPDYAYPRPVGV
jgi:hypothetical protein